MARGNCNCGTVRFEIDSVLTDVYICHCSICRRCSGGSGMAVLVVKNEAFRFTEGESNVTTWKKPGHDWQTWFCRTCGSVVPGSNDKNRKFIPAGLITDGGDSLQVAAHICVDSKANWDEIGDSAPRHPEGFRAENSNK